MLWEMPHDERPGHVQNPWYWMPDADVLDKMITVDTVSALSFCSISPMMSGEAV